MALRWAKTIGIRVPDGYALDNDSADSTITFLKAVMDWSAIDGPAELPMLAEISFDDLVSTRSERLERIPSVKVEGVQASKYVYGVPYAAPAGTPGSFLSNPDTALFNYSTTLNFSEAFLSVADRASTCKTVSTLKEARIGTAYDVKNSFCDDFRFLTGSGKRDALERMAAGVTLTYTASQNAKVQKSLVNASSGISFSNSLTGSFDPNKVWRSASDWVAAIGIYKPQAEDSIEADGDLHVKTTHDYPCLSLVRQDGCFYRYAYGRRSLQIFQALLPRVDIKVVTPLNFQAANNVFLAQPADERKRLYTISASLDLTRFVPNSKTRSDAASVMIALATQKRKEILASRAKPPVGPSVDDDWAKWRQQAAILYRDLATKPALLADAAWWQTFQATVLKISE